MALVHVLVIDDAAAVRTRLASMLAEIPGVDAVVEAESAEEAERMLVAEAPDIVVTDLQLRGGSGLRLLPRVKVERPDALVIVFSNQVGASLTRLCMTLGADHFFDKSMGLEALLLVVARASSSSTGV